MLVLPHKLARYAATGLAGLALTCLSLSAAERTFTSVDIGKVKPGSTKELTPGQDFEIRGFGGQFGLHKGSDEGRFVYTKLKGDFDITVQVRALENEDQSFAEVGLLVRQDLTPEGREIGQFVSSNYFGEQDQYTFIFRTQPGGSIEPWQENQMPDFWGKGSFGNPAFGYTAKGYSMERARPRPFPYVWLRLIRTGNTYRGLVREYLDSWTVIGIAQLDLGEEVLVGMALSANHHQRPGGLHWDDVAANVSLRDLTIKQ